MKTQVLEEEELIAQQKLHGVAMDCSLEWMIDGEATIADVIFQLDFYAELLGELKSRGWELADRAEGTWLFLKNPRHPMPPDDQG